MKIHILGDGTKYYRVDGNKNKKTIVIEESALDSIKAMCEQLQSERDELLDRASFVVARFMPDVQEYKFSQRLALHNLEEVIVKCTKEPEVM